jgi:hypothetical protein
LTPPGRSEVKKSWRSLAEGGLGVDLLGLGIDGPMLISPA